MIFYYEVGFFCTMDCIKMEQAKRYSKNCTECAYKYLIVSPLKFMWIRSVVGILNEIPVCITNENVVLTYL